jgi:ABC-type nitrate/sulfonate/bicarbonate transport system substrate-binding protein
MRLVKAAAILILFAAIGVTEAVAEPYHLRIGWVIPGGDIVTLMFAKPGLATHAGESYIPDLRHFEGTSSAVQALATADLDCVALAYSTFALGIVNLGMKDLQAIGDEFQDGVPGYHTNAFMVRNDSPIRTIEDLKGKVLASNERGSAADMAVRTMLAKNNLQDGRDLTIVEVRFSEQKAMLKEKKVDLITAVSPYGFDPELRAFSRPLFRQVDAIGRSQMTVRAARESFIKEHREVMVDFMEDYLRTLRFLQDPANHDETVALLAQVTKREPSFYQDWVFTKRDYFRDSRALPNLEALQANINLQKTLGFLRAEVEVDKHADLSLVKEAAARLDNKSGR